MKKKYICKKCNCEVGFEDPNFNDNTKICIDCEIQEDYDVKIKNSIFYKNNKLYSEEYVFGLINNQINEIEKNLDKKIDVITHANLSGALIYLVSLKKQLLDKKVVKNENS